jgi:hypothetical protein
MVQQIQVVVVVVVVGKLDTFNWEVVAVLVLLL